MLLNSFHGVNDAQHLVQLLADQHLSIAVAESLTGGGLCSRLVDIPGASAVLCGGVCTYTTRMKAELLGVCTDLLDAHGPVHEDVALQMALGATRLFQADIALATTGVAGPGPADGHPAGTVFIACVSPFGNEVVEFAFEGDRATVRESAIAAAISLTQRIIQAQAPLSSA